MDFDIKECCEALRVSRGGYYRWGQAEPSRREKENAQLVEQIREVFEANKSQGEGEEALGQCSRPEGTFTLLLVCTSRRTPVAPSGPKG